MLNKIKVILGITGNDKDDILSLLIEQAIEEAVNYTNNNDVANQVGLISNMVVWKYNRLGTIGVDSESYSGVNFKYSTDYPSQVLNELNSFRKVRTIK